jgi:hypothetical protein
VLAGTIGTIVPPAFSIAAFALADALIPLRENFLLSAPSPKILA